MRRSSAAALLLCAGVIFFAPPVLPARHATVYEVDATGGADRPCPADFAFSTTPDRSRVNLLAPVYDSAYAAAAAGPEGCGALLGAIALLAVLWALWTRGVRCALRRLVLLGALGAQLVLALLYLSCFLPGRGIALGPAARDEYVMASLHNHTNRSTGLLSPRQLVEWHYQRGFGVLCVSDKDTARGSFDAVRAAQARGLSRSGFVVLHGEEWQSTPHLVLVGTTKTWDPHRSTLSQVVEAIHAHGGAVILAHPWAKRRRPIAELLSDGVDAVEVVNGRIHGGLAVVDAARRTGKAMTGVLDYKYGCDVTAVTLLPRESARTPAGVAAALRAGKTRVLYAIAGGPLTGDKYSAGSRALSGAGAAFASFLQVPRGRRAIWFFWLVLGVFLYSIGTRYHLESHRRALWRVIFYLCFVVEILLLAGVSWQVRFAIGVVPVLVLLILAGVFAIPFLAAAHNLTRGARGGQ